VPRLGIWLVSACVTAFAFGLPGAQRACANEEAARLENDEALDRRAQKRLRSGDFAFCSSTTYRLWRDDKRELCAQKPALLEDCPGLQLACQRPAWEDQASDQDESPSWLGSLFDKLGIAGDALARILFWALLVVGLAWLVRLWAKRFAARQPVPVVEIPTSALPTARISFEGDDRSAAELLAAARALLETGAIREALHLLYRTTMVHLAENQLIVVHKSKTTRDYVAELPESVRREVRDLALSLDEQRFRPETPMESAARTLLARFSALPIMPSATSETARSARVLPVLLLLLLPLGGCSDLELPEDPMAPRGPRGFGLFEELLSENAESVSKKIRRVSAVDEETTTVISLSAPLVAFDWQVLHDWVESGGHLVVVEPNPEFAEVFDVDVKSEECGAPLLAPELRVRSVGALRGFAPQTEATARASCGSKVVADSSAHGEGWVTRVASRNLFENRALGVADNASLALGLADVREASVELLGPWTGEGAHHPLESLRRAGLGTWAAHVMVLLGLYALARGRRFGSPQDERTSSRRAFVEHAEALAAQYLRASASAFTLSRYAEWTWEMLRKRVASREDTPRSLARASTEGDAQAAELSRCLSLSRKASELGETEKQHLERFRVLEKAVAETRSR